MGYGLCAMGYMTDIAHNPTYICPKDGHEIKTPNSHGRKCHHRSPMEVPWEHHRIPLGKLGKSRRNPMEASWKQHHGRTMGLAWNFHGNHMGVPRKPRRGPMEHPRNHHGKTMGFPPRLGSVSTVTQSKGCGTMMFTDAVSQFECGNTAVHLRLLLTWTAGHFVSLGRSAY